MTKLACGWVLTLALCATGWAADKYSGPKPPKPDIPYLLHASTLIPTEVVEAREQSGKKDETTFVIPGAASEARTPLAEPIFIFESDKISPDRIELYRLQSRGNQREISVSRKAHKNARPLRLQVTRLDNRLYRLEVAETLENGEYSLSPADSNQAFCFAVY